ncbi:MAG: hypothetical protein ACRYFW_00325 [Janthinobacterium lividum]
MTIEPRLPADPAAARAALYAGRLFKTAPTAASLQLADAATALVARELGGADVRARATALPADELFARIGRVRHALFTGAEWHAAARAAMAASGFDPGTHAFDPLRLRAVLHRGHEIAAAQAVYLAHRDTWYAHPPATITCWIPLDDLPTDETFVFYPEAFDAAVPNDSELFDYAAWVSDGPARRIGWQRREDGTQARYPGLLGEDVPHQPLGFDCRRGEVLFFSGAHLHRTLPQASGRARFSLDFRIAHLGDVAAELGAPDVDNRSTGSAVPDYVQPGGASARASAAARPAFSAKPPGSTS